MPTSSIRQGRPVWGALFRARVLHRLRCSLGVYRALPAPKPFNSTTRTLNQSGALFAVFLSFPATTSANWPELGMSDPACAEALTTETAKIQRITDGDTVVLADNRRVRLIGINTPELNAPDESLRLAAVESRQALTKLLPENEPVLLYVGHESQDRHQRVLAHVVRKADRLAVAPALLQQGRAMHIAVAPNILCAAHFAQLEKLARGEQLGVWKLNEALSTQAKSINRKSLGFKLITGTVTRVQTKKRHTQLMLDDNLVVLIRKALANQLESDGGLSALIGQQVEVRGWLSRSKNKVRLWLQHPANLRPLGE